MCTSQAQTTEDRDIYLISVALKLLHVQVQRPTIRKIHKGQKGKGRRVTGDGQVAEGKQSTGCPSFLLLDMLSSVSVCYIQSKHAVAYQSKKGTVPDCAVQTVLMSPLQKFLLSPSQFKFHFITLHFSLEYLCIHVEQGMKVLLRLTKDAKMTLHLVSGRLQGMESNRRHNRWGRWRPPRDRYLLVWRR